MSKNLLTAVELQALLKVKHTAFYKMLADNAIPFVMVGGRKRFPLDEVERHLGCKLYQEENV